jgi:hypothetical protein
MMFIKLSNEARIFGPRKAEATDGVGNILLKAQLALCIQPNPSIAISGNFRLTVCAN